MELSSDESCCSMAIIKQVTRQESRSSCVAHKDNSNVVIGWMLIEELEDVVIYPEFIKEQIHDLDAPPQHFVTRA